MRTPKIATAKGLVAALVLLCVGSFARAGDDDCEAQQTQTLSAVRINGESYLVAPATGTQPLYVSGAYSPFLGFGWGGGTGGIDVNSLLRELLNHVLERPGGDVTDEEIKALVDEALENDERLRAVEDFEGRLDQVEQSALRNANQIVDLKKSIRILARKLEEDGAEFTEDEKQLLGLDED